MDGAAGRAPTARLVGPRKAKAGGEFLELGPEKAPEPRVRCFLEARAVKKSRLLLEKAFYREEHLPRFPGASESVRVTIGTGHVVRSLGR